MATHVVQRCDLPIVDLLGFDSERSRDRGLELRKMVVSPGPLPPGFKVGPGGRQPAAALARVLPGADLGAPLLDQSGRRFLAVGGLERQGPGEDRLRVDAGSVLQERHSRYPTGRWSIVCADPDRTRRATHPFLDLLNFLRCRAALVSFPSHQVRYHAVSPTAAASGSCGQCLRRREWLRMSAFARGRGSPRRDAPCCVPRVVIGGSGTDSRGDGSGRGRWGGYPQDRWSARGRRRSNGLAR